MKKSFKFVFMLSLVLVLAAMFSLYAPEQSINAATSSLEKASLKQTCYSFTEGDGKVKIKFDKKPSKVTITYSSSNENVAKVTKNGYIHPKKEGYCTITCTVTSRNAITPLTVCVAVKSADTAKGKYSLKDLWEKGKDEGLDIEEINANFGDIVDIPISDSFFAFTGNPENVYVDYTLKELDYWDSDSMNNYLAGIVGAGYTPASECYGNFGSTDLMSKWFINMRYETSTYDKYGNSWGNTNITHYYECTQPGVFYLFCHDGHYKKITVSDKTSEGVNYADIKRIDSSGWGLWNEKPMYTSKKTYVYKYDNGTFAKSKKKLAKDTKVFMQAASGKYTRIFWGGNYAHECMNVGWVPTSSLAGVKYTAPDISKEQINKWLDNWGRFTASDAKKYGLGDENGLNDALSMKYDNGYRCIYIKLPSGYRYSNAFSYLYYKSSKNADIYDKGSEYMPGYVAAHYACITYRADGFDNLGKCQYSIGYASDATIMGE